GCARCRGGTTKPWSGSRKPARSSTSKARGHCGPSPTSTKRSCTPAAARLATASAPCDCSTSPFRSSRPLACPGGFDARRSCGGSSVEGPMTYSAGLAFVPRDLPRRAELAQSVKSTSFETPVLSAVEGSPQKTAAPQDERIYPLLLKCKS